MIIPFYPPDRSPSNPRTRSHSPTVVWMKWQAQVPAPQQESSPYSDASSSAGLPPPAISDGRSKGYLHSDLSLGVHAALTVAFLFVFDSIPRLFYLHLLLRIPSLYFSRVTRIFEDARLSLPDIKRMARARAEQWNFGGIPRKTTRFHLCF
ncbi:hypothetical protein B0H17DRAFT_74584 [Mycena rosella]|uniref:Uncharacterized protein n=1 Tax=Mycena rosella TaxID=1033263 RepID=A0AAD7GBX1_MYCRO|nr:hypothetical protein B0H17DRAFT_74584 [Mycena rosella]